MKPHAHPIAAVLVALTAAGCTSIGPAAPSPDGPGQVAVGSAVECPAGEKLVAINQVTIAPSGDTATINLIPGRRFINPRGDGVRWTLSGNLYEFTSDGVSFGPPNYLAQPPAGSVTAAGHGNSLREFVVCFGNTATLQKWYYNIKFYDKSKPETVWICDPTIVNTSPMVDLADEDVPCRLVK